MDEQRQYTSDADRWYDAEDPGRHPYAEASYSDAPAYGASGYPEQAPYGQQGGYGEQQQQQPGYPDERYGEPTGYPGGADTSRRRATARTRRVGKRSGLEIPDADAEVGMHDPVEESSDGRYRAERIDRQALRRDPTPDPRAGEPASQLLAPQPPVPAAPQSPIQSTGTTYMPLQQPTQSMATPPPAVYLSRRPGVAALLGIGAVVIDLLLVRMLLSGEFAHTVIGSDVLGAAFGMAGVPMVAIGVYGLAIGAASASGPNVGRAWLRTPLAYLPVGLLLVIAAAIAA